jgi:hypothetical protein
MFCPKCGTQVVQGNSYCQNCGAAIGQPAAAPQPQAYTAPPMSGQPFAAAVKTNGLAVASLVLGIIGMIGAGGFLSILAIVFGAISMSHINKSNGMEKGKGMAVAGLILGIVGIVLGIIIIAFVGFNLFWIRDISNEFHL